MTRLGGVEIRPERQDEATSREFGLQIRNGQPRCCDGTKRIPQLEIIDFVRHAAPLCRRSIMSSRHQGEDI